MAILRRILNFWKPHRRVGAGLLVTMLLQALFTVVVALGIKLIIDAVVGGDGDDSPAFVIALLTGGFVAAAAAGIANGYSGRPGGRRHPRRCALCALRPTSATLDRFPPALTGRRPDLALLHRRSAVVRWSYQDAPPGPEEHSCHPFYLPVMFVLEPHLAAAAAGAAPLAVFLVNRYSPDADSALEKEKMEIALVLNEVSENLRAQTAIRAFGLGRRSRDKFRQRISSLHASSSIADFRVQLAAALSEYSVALAQVAIVGLGAILALGGSLEPGTLAAFVALLVEFAWESTVIGRDVLPGIKKAWSGIRRIDGLLANPAPTASGEGDMTPALEDSVRFEDVSFRYSAGGGSLQLADVNLSIEAGSYVAVVGASGSGKSTLLSLLLRFYDPTAGQISIDSIPLTEFDAEGMRALTGAVFQETFLFNTSLRDNIILSESPVSDLDLELVLESTGLDEVVRNLPEGLDTVIGAVGRQLSGGQAQRVGLTRALLRNPRLLLLDEATSALDPSTEAAVVETIGRIRHGRTVVMVTHRLQTVVDADLIVVMRNGVVDEVGRFEELLESGSTFAEVWSKQRGFVVGRDGRSASVTTDRLAAIPLFSVLSEESLNQLAGDFVAQQHASGTVIFKEGDLGDRFFVNVRGVVEVSKSSVDGENVVAHLEDGDFFGEMALLDTATRNATVVAITPTTTLSLDRDQFRAMIEGTPEMAVAVQAIAAARSTENGTS